jgi:hypothetical protein
MKTFDRGPQSTYLWIFIKEDSPMKAYEILEKPENWAQGFYAYKSDGNQVSSSDPEACRWCVLGALYKKHGWNEEEDFVVPKPKALMDDIIRLTEFIGRDDGKKSPIPCWNDRRATHSEVVRVLKELDI